MTKNGAELGPISNRVRYICSNRSLYRNAESLRAALDRISTDPKDFDVTLCKWYYTNDWWNDQVFVEAMRECGVRIPDLTEIVIMRPVS